MCPVVSRVGRQLRQLSELSLSPVCAATCDSLSALRCAPQRGQEQSKGQAGMLFDIKEECWRILRTRGCVELKNC